MREGVKVRGRSRPVTPDRRSVTWEEAGGGGEGGEGERGKGEREDERMRRPSLQSAEGPGLSVSLLDTTLHV